MQVQLRPDVQPFNVILPTHSHLKLTMDCIGALYANTALPFHLIVVDDSTDLTPLYFQELQKEHDNITFLHSDTPYKSGNQFFNIALQHCQHPFVATVMNSVCVEPDWELMALQILKTSPKVGIVGIKCLLPNGLIESVGLTFRGHIPLDLGRGRPGYAIPWNYEAIAVQWACAFLRKEAIGILEENTYHGFVGWDDIDNCMVVREKGWTIMACGQGVALHNPRATRGNNAAEVTIKNRQNAEKFLKRWGFWKQFRKVEPKAPEYFKHIKEKEMPEFAKPFIQPLPTNGMNRADRRRLIKEGQHAS